MFHVECKIGHRGPVWGAVGVRNEAFSSVSLADYVDPVIFLVQDVDDLE